MFEQYQIMHDCGIYPEETEEPAWTDNTQAYLPIYW